MEVGDIIEAEMKTPKHEKNNKYFPLDKKHKTENEDNDKKSREFFARNDDIKKCSLYNFIMLGIIFTVIYYILKIRGCF
jgi:hypothetical protein